MKSDLVSIIIPVYKAEKYLAACLDSVISQTYSNWECILVDDGSPDASGKICDDYVNKDKRFKVIHKNNAGVTSARKDGVDLSTGEWITFVDSDDIIISTAIEVMVSKAKHSNEIDIVVGAWVRQTSGFHRPIPLRVNGIINNTQLINAFLSGRCYFGPVGKLFKRSLFSDLTFSAPNTIVNNEDLIMNLCLTHGARDIVCCPRDYVYIYRCNLESASHKIDNNDWNALFNYIGKNLPAECKDSFLDYLLETAIKYNLKYEFIQRWDERLINKHLPFYLNIKLRGGFLRDNIPAIIMYKLNNLIVKFSKLPTFLYYKLATKYRL